MSRKGKKKGRNKFRPPVRVGTVGPGGIQSAAPAAQRTLSQARVGGDQATIRAVEMSLGARNQIVKSRGGRMVVQNNDPSIPLDRVPYFTKDLVRLSVVIAAMGIFLVVGSLLVPQVVK
jgi:hypothetical protein